MKLDSAFQMDKDLFDSLLKDNLISKEAHRLAVADRRMLLYRYGCVGSVIYNCTEDPDYATAPFQVLVFAVRDPTGYVKGLSYISICLSLLEKLYRFQGYGNRQLRYEKTKRAP